jgi:hypothetical protein
MRVITLRAITLVTLAATLQLLPAQQPSTQTGKIGSGANAQRRPYTAEFKTTTIRTLANGTTITQTRTSLDAVDSAGRTLHDEEYVEGDQHWHFVHIYDPAARSNTSWDTRFNRATVTTTPSTAAGQTSTCFSISPAVDSVPAERLMPPIESKDQITREELGRKIIFGVETKGTRITRTTPTGVRGNDAPLVSTTETWAARGFHIALETHTESAESGSTVRELTKLEIDEPDPALFTLRPTIK